MTISSTTAYGSATGTGITGPYAIPFSLYNQTDLSVLLVANGVVTELVLGTDYSFSSFVQDNKGQCASPAITFTDTVASGTLIVFLLTPPGTQSTAISNFSEFFPTIHEAEFDLLSQFALKLFEWAKKTIKAPDYEQSGTADLTLPSIADRAGKVLGFDPGGNVEAVSGGGAVSTSDTILVGVSYNQSLVTGDMTYSGSRLTIKWTGHPFLVGDYAGLNGFDQEVYDALLKVTAVPDADHFCVDVSGSAPAPTGTPSLNYRIVGTRSSNVDKIARIEQTGGGQVAFLLAQDQTDTFYQVYPASGINSNNHPTVGVVVNIYVGEFDLYFQNYEGSGDDPDIYFFVRVSGLI